MKKRQSGVLMHISSLPGAYGIGSFGKSGLRLRWFLGSHKTTFTGKILPLGTTSSEILLTNLSQPSQGTLILSI